MESNTSVQNGPYSSHSATLAAWAGACTPTSSSIIFSADKTANTFLTFIDSLLVGLLVGFDLKSDQGLCSYSRINSRAVTSSGLDAGYHGQSANETAIARRC